MTGWFWDWIAQTSIKNMQLSNAARGQSDAIHLGIKCCYSKERDLWAGTNSQLVAQLLNKLNNFL